MSTPLHHRISLSQVRKSFTGPGGAMTALQGVSLDVAEGEIVCLLGPSGCGKSTVLNLVAGFEQPDEGQVLFDGNPVLAPGPERGVVFQQPQLFPWLDVLGNVTFAPRLAGVSPGDYLPRAGHLLDLVGLAGFERHAPYQLSGGMRQRVALARAWLAEPQVLLLDEPFGALDAQTRLMMQELLLDIWQRTRTTLLFITHDVDEALVLADRVLLMSARPGTVIADLKVPFARPRSIEDIVIDPGFGELKHHILHQVRAEARRVKPSALSA